MSLASLNLPHNDSLEEEEVRRAYAEPVMPWQVWASKALTHYMYPILIFPGTIGNVLALVVLQATSFRKTSCGFLLSALALVDIGVLNTELLRFWILNISKRSLDVRNLSEDGCKAHIFFSFVFPQLSSWTLVLVTIDRVVSVVMPLRSREICTKPRMVAAWIFVTVVLASLNIQGAVHAILKTVERGGRTFQVCAYDSNSTGSDTVRQVGTRIDFVFLAVLPMIIITTCNAFIIYKMFKAKMRRKLSLRAMRGSTSSRRGNQSSRTLTSATVMLVVVNITFVVTTIPKSAFYLAWPWPIKTFEDFASANLLYESCFFIYNISNACNFLLYCVSGTKFRRAATQLLCHHRVVDSFSGSK